MLITRKWEISFKPNPKRPTFKSAFCAVDCVICLPRSHTEVERRVFWKRDLQLTWSTELINNSDRATRRDKKKVPTWEQMIGMTRKKNHRRNLSDQQGKKKIAHSYCNWPNVKSRATLGKVSHVTATWTGVLKLKNDVEWKKRNPWDFTVFTPCMNQGKARGHISNKDTWKDGKTPTPRLGRLAGW